MSTQMAINSFDVDFTDYYDMKGDIFHVQKDPENEEFFCLIRERSGVCVVVGFDKNPETFEERIENARKL